MARRIVGALSLLAMTAFVTPAADLYQWTDGDGVRHYTSDPTSIPDVLDYFTLTVDSTAGRAVLTPR